MNSVLLNKVCGDYVLQVTSWQSEQCFASQCILIGVLWFYEHLRLQGKHLVGMFVSVAIVKRMGLVRMGFDLIRQLHRFEDSQV
jgi:hypothetical protein